MCQTETYLVVAKSVLQEGWPESQVQHADIHRSPGNQSLQQCSRGAQSNLQNINVLLLLVKPGLALLPDTEFLASSLHGSPAAGS